MWRAQAFGVYEETDNGPQGYVRYVRRPASPRPRTFRALPQPSVFLVRPTVEALKARGRQEFGRVVSESSRMSQSLSPLPPLRARFVRLSGGSTQYMPESNCSRRTLT